MRACDQIGHGRAQVGQILLFPAGLADSQIIRWHAIVSWPGAGHWLLNRVPLRAGVQGDFSARLAIASLSMCVSLIANDPLSAAATKAPCLWRRALFG